MSLQVFVFEKVSMGKCYQHILYSILKITLQNVETCLDPIKVHG